LLFSDNFWKTYIAPREAIAEAFNRCGLEANKIFALDIARWIEAHNTDQNDPSNPFRRQRDAYIEICVKTEGWCSIGSDRSWPNIFTWAYAPRGAVAKWIYALRYENGEHFKCD
jgi:hypothetical protein